MASCTSPQWPRISRQCLHENTKYGVLNFRNGPNSSSILIQWLSCMEAGRRNKPLISGIKRFLSNSPRSRQQQWKQCQKFLIWVYWKICCNFIAEFFVCQKTDKCYLEAEILKNEILATLSNKCLPLNKHSLASPCIPSRLKSIGHPLLGLFPDPQKLNYLSPSNIYYMYTWSQTCSLTYNTSLARIEK